MIGYSNSTLKPDFKNSLEGDVEKSLADNSLIKEKINWEPQMELKTWLRSVLSKLEENN